jgi:hypothetical protein
MAHSAERRVLVPNEACTSSNEQFRHCAAFVGTLLLSAAANMQGHILHIGSHA